MRAPLVDTLYAAAKWMLDLKDIPRALDLFRAMIVSAPGDTRSWLGLGACHEARGQSAIALEIYAMGVAACGDARCHVARSRLLRKLGRDDDADVALAEAAAAASDEETEALVEQERRAA